MAIDFDKPIQFNPNSPNSSSDITLSATGDTEDTTSFNSEDSRLSIQDKTLTVLLTNLLLVNTEYTFTLPQNTLFDDTDTGNEEYTLTFTTTDKPSIDASLFSINTNTWYERKSTDNGSFDQVITITYPTIPVAVSNNDSLTGVFDTDLTNQIGTSAVPVTISGLPDGLKLQIAKQTGGVQGVQISLIGNAISHQRDIDNTSLKITLLEEFFIVPNDYVSSDIDFDFDIIFGSAHWSKRSYHQAFAYDDKLWVLGGNNNNNKLNDIWTSSNKGTNWSKVIVNNSHWSGRQRHQAFAYDDKLWLLAGDAIENTYKNDIWYSDDKGINWSKVIVDNSHWLGRYAHQALSHNDKLWVLGGIYGGNQIWSSTNGGTNWSQVTVNGHHWGVHDGHQAFEYDNKLWVLGGSALSYITNSIWRSADGGVNWSQVTVNGEHWSGRNDHQAFAYDNKLWVLGGILGGYTDVSGRTNDIWSSADGGTNWSQVTVNGNHWSRRSGHEAFVYDNQFWVLGGRDNNGNYQNDIWTSSDGGVNWVEIVPEYY